MKRSRLVFPDPRTAGENGLLCVGGDLTIDTLYEAYRHGIFPWPQEGYPMLWFCPEQRGILNFAHLHWPRRFLRELKDQSFQITFDQAFEQVILNCAKVPRAHEAGTWIFPEMVQAYLDFFKAGHAHSVECWQDGVLVGGLYGVWVEGVFSGESMFHHVSGASKRCLFALVERLQKNGVSWIDTQMVTPILKSFGGTYIDRGEYLSWIAAAQKSLHDKRIAGLFNERMDNDHVIKN